MQENSIRAEHQSLGRYLESVLNPEELLRPLIVNFNHWNFVQFAYADIAMTLHKLGSDIKLALWADQTPMRDIAWSSSKNVTRFLRSPSREEYISRALLNGGIKQSAFVTPPIRRWAPVEPIHLPNTLNRKNIRAMQYRGADIGRAILQVHPDSETPVSDSHEWPSRWVAVAAQSFAFVFDQVSQLIIRNSITSVIIYNGRFLHDRAAAAAAQQLSIPILSYDTGGSDTDFDLTIDETHDWSKLQSRMLTMYDTWDSETRNNIGSAWFTNRVRHLDEANQAYTDAQTVGLSIDVPAGKRLVVFFSSSGDEIAELDLDWNEYFGTQDGALHSLSDECKKFPDIYLVVRTHPHKRRKPKLDVESWHETVKKVNPDLHLDEFSDVDSYALMRQADIVVTYGSTTGIEAAFANKPVIVMGPSAYDELGAAKRVTNAGQLHEALIAPQSGDPRGALAFGLMMTRRGFNYENIVKGPEYALNDVTLRDSNQLALNISNYTARLVRRRLLG